jgi:hypothetical protein
MYLSLVKCLNKTGLSGMTLCLLFVGAQVMAKTGDDLIVTGSIVNMRAGPSLEAKVLLRFVKGTQVIEISRFQEWVEVATRRNDIDTGWIHDSLLASVDPQTQDLAPDIAVYNEFREDFDALVERVKSTHGIDPFSGLERVQRGRLAITASKDWFSMQQTERESLLSEIFNLWRQRVETGYSVMVEIIDNNDEQHMMMFR